MTVGISQTSIPQSREVGIRPRKCPWLPRWIATVTFQQLPTESPPDHPIIGIEDTPGAVAKVGEPSRRDLIDLGNRFLQRLTRFAGRQFAHPIDHLPTTRGPEKTKLPAERIAQKLEARLT